MSQKMKPVMFIPSAYPMSDIYGEPAPDDEQQGDEAQANSNGWFDVSDEGKEIEQNLEKLDFEQRIIEIMSFLDDKDKVIFLYQILRDYGCKLSHDVCAKTMHINRQWYMVKLSDVRAKVKLFLMGKERQTVL